MPARNDPTLKAQPLRPDGQQLKVQVHVSVATNYAISFRSEKSRVCQAVDVH